MTMMHLALFRSGFDDCDLPWLRLPFYFVIVIVTFRFFKYHETKLVFFKNKNTILCLPSHLPVPPFRVPGPASKSRLQVFRLQVVTGCIEQRAESRDLPLILLFAQNY